MEIHSYVYHIFLLWRFPFFPRYNTVKMKSIKFLITLNLAVSNLNLNYIKLTLKNCLILYHLF